MDPRHDDPAFDAHGEFTDAELIRQLQNCHEHAQRGVLEDDMMLVSRALSEAGSIVAVIQHRQRVMP